MKVVKGSITSLARRGYMTVQIPDVVFEISGQPKVEFEEHPDDFFTVLNGHEPRRLDRSGYLHLSEKGWKHFKEDIRAAFQDAILSGRTASTWDDFEKDTKEHFRMVRKALKKKIASTKRKLEEYRALRA